MGIDSGKFYDAKKTAAYFDLMKKNKIFYDTRARGVFNSYQTFASSASFQGNLALNTKTFVNNGLGKMLQETLDIHEKMVEIQGAIIDAFETMVDSSQNARIEYDTMELIDKDFKGYYNAFIPITENVSAIVGKLEREFGDYATFNQPDSKTAKTSFEIICGGENENGGYFKECQNKLVVFDSEVKNKLKTVDIPEHTHSIVSRLRNAGQGMLSIMMASVFLPVAKYATALLSTLKKLTDGADKFEKTEDAFVIRKMDVVNENARENISMNSTLNHYEFNCTVLEGLNNPNTGNFDGELARIKEKYEENKEVYMSISEKTGVPPELICAIHYRENTSLNLDIYLHNGQKLGQPTTIVPKGIYFDDYEEAAIDALTKKIESTGITFNENTDMATCLTFAESFNGYGYSNNGRVSPYLYSGTDVYESGKYTSDSHYDPNCVDKQVGVYCIMNALMEDEN